MSGWPDGVTVGPIREWPGAVTPGLQRKASPFSANLTDTLDVLDREVFMLTDSQAQRNSLEVLVAIPAEQFRLDGTPRAQAKAEHPGVIVSFDSRHGHLSYPCDTFITWQANLRAITLALESLRRVDRYGVTKHGQQYRGFLALEATAAAVMTFDGALAVVAAAAGISEATVMTDIPFSLRRAKRKAHPDTGGTPEQWHAIAEAERVFRAAGRL